MWQPLYAARVAEAERREQAARTCDWRIMTTRYGCLRAGDMWLGGVRRYRAVERQLIPPRTDERLIGDYWTDGLRLAALIRTGVTDAFAMPDRLSS